MFYDLESRAPKVASTLVSQFQDIQMFSMRYPITCNVYTECLDAWFVRLHGR